VDITGAVLFSSQAKIVIRESAIVNGSRFLKLVSDLAPPEIIAVCRLPSTDFQKKIIANTSSDAIRVTMRPWRNRKTCI